MKVLWDFRGLRASMLTPLASGTSSHLELSCRFLSVLLVSGMKLRGG